ncbi:UDP-glucose dehydrogenase family protein [Bacillus taeanensis]|uniref:UDP-glucose 6-dehydrogenase n=1 Tax=Bacillus taeanensis TaxID=273032 RepID=A0A366XVN8_9BACI|nr:UDP-glucose/GDP-mannose dehydrogenase family protein [Bacillus taeanensis]RBW69967.1 UDP-glucose/GDP-mannose dehydrogenase family protein [Bacillus taeanensis]
MNVGIIGAGYVGLTTAAVLSDLGHHVVCIDTDSKKISTLNSGICPIYEEGLEALIQENMKKKRLVFTTPNKNNLENSEIIMITVGTPPKENGEPNLSYLEHVIEDVSRSLSSYKIIVTKSTVPPGTNEWIHSTLLKKGLDSSLFDVVSNPEFLREGTALYDTLHPDRIVIGVNGTKPIPIIQKLYRNINAPYIITSLSGAEMIKYASNAFLATKISFINELSRICDAYGVNVEDVALGIGSDKRIGHHFLKSGLGYGGSCLPKDISALQRSAFKKNISPSLLQAVQDVNNTQIDFYLEKLFYNLPSKQNLRITVLGIAFKPNTDDMRFSPALSLINKLIEKKIDVHGYDPICKPTLANFTLHNDLYDSIKDSDAIIIATEWQEFQKINWKKVKNLMKGSLLLDTRNCLRPKTVTANGLTYISIANQ